MDHGRAGTSRVVRIVARRPAVAHGMDQRFVEIQNQELPTIRQQHRLGHEFFREVELPEVFGDGPGLHLVLIDGYLICGGKVFFYYVFGQFLRVQICSAAGAAGAACVP